MIYYKYSPNSNAKNFILEEFFESCSDSKHQKISENSNESKLDEKRIIDLEKAKIHSKLSTPIVEQNLFNGKTYKKKLDKHRSNNVLPFTETKLKSTEIYSNKKKNNILYNSNNSFSNVSNGETNEIYNNYKNNTINNYDLIRKKLLLISKKDKKIAIKDNNRRASKSQTTKEIQNLFNFNEEKKKEFKRKISKRIGRRANKSMTIFNLNPENLSKIQNYGNTFKFLKSRQEWDKNKILKYNKTEKNEKAGEELTIFTYKDKRSFSVTKKKTEEKKSQIFHHKNTTTINRKFQLPSLGVYNNPFLTERQNPINNNNNLNFGNLHKTVNIRGNLIV